MPFYRGTREALLHEPVFTPLQLSGISAGGLWLKADAGTFQDAARTVVASADADPVGGWADQSGSGNHVSQATAANKPLLKLNIQNGRSVVRGDGVLSVISATLTAASAWSFFIVARANAFLPTNGRAFSFGSGTTINLFDRDNGAGWGFYQNEAGGVDTIGGPSSVFGILSLVFVNNTSASARLNASSLISFDPIAFDAATFLALFAASAIPTAALNCDIAEFIAVPNAVSAPNRTATENYLNGRWGY